MGRRLTETGSAPDLPRPHAARAGTTRSATSSLLLAPSFHPAVGGIETLLYQTNRRLQRPPRVVAPPPAAADHLSVTHARPAPRGLPGRAAHRAAWAVHPSLAYLHRFWQPALAAARAEAPNVVQCGHAYLLPLAWLVARRLRRPMVAYAYGQEVWRAGLRVGFSPLDAALRGATLRSAEAILSLGTFTSGLLVDGWGVARDVIREVPFGADPRPPVAPPHGATLLSVARLVPRKGIDTMLRALPRVLAAAPGVEYRVVGSGPDEARLRRLAAEVGVVHAVQFLGRLDEAALAQEYARCALFVLPARRTTHELEGLGLVYLEAAAWGRPVVAGRSGGEADAVLDGQTGCLVDGDDPDALASVVIGLLADQERLRALGAAGRQRVETDRNWDHAAAVVDAVLAEVAGAPPRP